MPSFSLVPVDHQPDFGDVSFVPVDHDPFSADGVTQQAQTQPESQPQRLATSNVPIPGDVNAAPPGAYQNPNVGLAAVLTRAATGLATLPQRAIDASAADMQHLGEEAAKPAMKTSTSKIVHMGHFLLKMAATREAMNAPINFIRAGYRLYQPQYPWGWPNTLYWYKSLKG
jgi:hypothetical protein